MPSRRPNFLLSLKVSLIPRISISHIRKLFKTPAEQLNSTVELLKRTLMNTPIQFGNHSKMDPKFNPFIGSSTFFQSLVDCGTFHNS